MDMFNPRTIDEAKQVAKALAKHAKDAGVPCAFEVVKTPKNPFQVQVFGTHTTVKSHKLLHIEPIPA